MSVLLIHLSSQLSVAKAAIVSDKLTDVQLYPDLEINKLSQNALGKQVIVLLPSTDITLLQASLPTARPSQLRRAAPFAIEEDISGDINQYHFALDQKDASPKTTIAVCDLSLMQQWTNLFEQAGIKVNVMLPEALALPLPKNQWTLLVGAESTLLRTQINQGYRVDNSNLLQWLTLSLSQCDVLPERIHFYCKEACPFDWEVLSQQHPDIHFASSPCSDPMVLFSEGLRVSPSSLNVLQGDFAGKREQRLNKSWRLARALAIVLISASVFSHAGEYWMLSRQNVQLDQKIKTIYQQVFPQATTMVSPRLRFQRRQQQLLQQAQGSPWQQVIGKAGPVLKQTKGLELKKLSFQNNRLSLNVVLDNFDQLKQFTQTLTKTGVIIVQRDAKTRNGKVIADIDITRSAR